MRVYNLFILVPLTVGFAWVMLLAARKERFHWKHLFDVFQENYWHVIGGFFIKWVILLAGFYLLVVPGIYFAIKLFFVEYLIVDRKMGIVDAFQESWRMTEGRELPIFVMLFLSTVVLIAGLLTCYVGVLFSVMWMTAAYAVFYSTCCLRDPGPERA